MQQTALEEVSFVDPYLTANVDPNNLLLDRSRDALVSEFGKAVLSDRYFYNGEDIQSMFARVAAAGADDVEHAQRLYEYFSKHWAVPATPVLSNLGSKSRGLPISCFVGDTEVITDAGFKCIQDIKEGDLVLTHKNRFRRVEKTKKSMSEDVYELIVNRRRTPLKVTGNHLLYTNSGWKCVRDLNSRVDLVAANSSLFVDTADHAITIINKNTQSVSGQFARTELNTTVFVDIDLAWALGFWFAEGSTTDMGMVRVTHGEKDPCERWTNIMCSAFGLKHSAVDISNTGTWFNGDVCSKTLQEWFDSEFGKGCKIKQLASWIVKLPIDKLQAFYDGLYLGDGFKTTYNNAIELANPALIAGVHLILLRLGVEHSLQLRKRTKQGFNGIIIESNNTNRWRHANGLTKGINFHDGLNYNYIISIEKVEGEFEVYDIEVEEDASFSAAGVIAHNCFLNEVQDDIEGIFSIYTENAYLAADGGGIGTYWSNLRSIGKRVRETGTTCGIVPFMKIMDSSTLAVSQGNLRRGSAAVYLNIHHPEIEEFLDVRKPTGGDVNRKTLNLHHGVVITDVFMDAVEKDKEHELIDPKDNDVVKKVPARELWQKILTTRIETGEPYIIFIDTVNKHIPDFHKKRGLLVKTSNLCSEIVLPTSQERSAVCCLSQINQYYYEDWRKAPMFVEDIVRFADNVLTYFTRRAPQERMKKSIFSAAQERSLGIGVMGFHSLLQKKRIPFESAMAKALNINIGRYIQKKAQEATVKLAQEKGACPDARMYGVLVRNANVTAIAPTASVSIILGNISPSMEPFAGNAFTHKTLSGSFLVKNKEMEILLEEKGKNDDKTWSSIITHEGSVQHLDFLSADEKEIFRTAFELDQRWIIEHASTRQKYVDQSISTNLFLPADVQKAELNYIHFLAWKRGLKSLYYCRSKSLRRSDKVSHKVERVRPVEDDTCIACQ